MQRHLAAGNSGNRSKGTALLLSTSNIFSSSHFEIGRSKHFFSTQFSPGATYLKLGKVADEVQPILSNFLYGTMWVMVLPRMQFFSIIIIILNLSVIVVSRSCTRRKTNWRQKFFSPVPKTLHRHACDACDKFQV